ncbi:MAG: YHS domain-containing protein [Phycisphaeraceae bacterium]|nr:YHS domain-containing protein [Phycisphaeraceae bacterium]
MKFVKKENGQKNVNSASHALNFQGQTIGFCCDDCIKPFNANPEKYAAALLSK